MKMQPEIKKAEVLSGISFTAKNAVECKVPIKEEETLEEVCSLGRVSINYIDCEQGEVRYGGKVVFSVSYGVSELKKAEVGVEFSYKTQVEGVAEGDQITADAWLENVKLSVVNGLPTVTGAVVLKGRVEKGVEFDYIRQCDGLCVKKEEIENSLLCGVEKKSFNIEEEFDTQIIIGEVLSHVETVKVLSVLSGIGAVAVSGEIELGMVVLPVDGTPTYHKQVIPFRHEHEIQKVMPDLISISTASLSDANLKIVVDKNKEKSTVFMSADINLITRLYENKNLSYITDAYSLSKELSFEKSTKKACTVCAQRYVDEKFEQSGISKSFENSRLVAPLFAKIEQIDIKNEQGEVEISGVLEVSFLLKSESGYNTQSSNVPFTIKDKTSCDKVSISSYSVTDLSASLDGGGITVSYKISVLLEERCEKTFTYICNIEEVKDKEINLSAISVCIPSANDTLWELSKALGVPQDEILKLNPNLTFPLTGEERVIVYRELK